MHSDLPLFPDSASTFAEKIDLLYLFLVSLAAFFTILVFTLVFYFAVRYRRRSETEQPAATKGGLWLEIVWSVIPLGLAMMVFTWGAFLYFEMVVPPSNALEIFVVGKQWMWKIQHPEGVREINELHIPAGIPVKLTMTSEDVIHSFYVPAFRVKQDVVPGRYRTLWFEATEPGEYHLFCAEYCGTKHSGMIGKVVVMEPIDYQAWLSGGAPPESMAEAGEKLFQKYQCHTCHHARAGARGPSLVGVFESEVKLQTGEQITVDEGYLRESILNPNAKVVAGYRPVMPTSLGQLKEDEVLQLISYIKTLTPETENRP